MANSLGLLLAAADLYRTAASRHSSVNLNREMSRVRDELDRMQGRMRVLADRTSLTTVQLDSAELHN